VARPGFNLNQIDSKKIAVPGIWTTACMLLGLYLSRKPDVVPMPFDLIMPAVERGDFDFGVIIHEGRFTYKNYGLISLLDLGKWWEQKTSLPIPLGGIAIRRDIAPEIVRSVETAIRESTLYGFKHRTGTDGYVKKYAGEMSSAVIRRHIDLYVNDFTIEIGEQGKEAVEALFEMARNRGILPESKKTVFVF
jgi:1,4-dihydroxy-6-naphthoate synthase